MPLVDGAYVNWGYDNQMPRAWSADPSKWGLTNEYWTPIVCNFDRDRLYRGYFADIDTDENSNPITPVISVFGITTYSMSSKVALGYVDLQAYFGSAFDATNETLLGFWLLPKSYEGTGADLILIHHTIEQASGGNPLACRATLVNMETGSVLFSTSLPTFSALGGSITGTSPYFRDAVVCNIGETPNNWYVIGRNAQNSPNGGNDWFSVYEIISDGSTGGLTTRHTFSSIGSGVGQSMRALPTWRSDSDGISYWICHDHLVAPKLDYIKWNWPWAAPTISLSVHSFATAARFNDMVYHLTDEASYIVASRWDIAATPDRQYVEALTFTSPTSTYTQQYTVDTDVTGNIGTSTFPAENTLFATLQGLDFLTANVRKGRDSVFINNSAISDINDRLWILCIDSGTLTNATTSYNSNFASIEHDVNGVFYSADPGGVASFPSNEIKSRSSTMNELCSVAPPPPPEGDDESFATILESIGQFNPLIRAITEQPCPVLGSMSSPCLTGRSSWPPGIGQLLCGREDVTLPCD